MPGLARSADPLPLVVLCRGAVLSSWDNRPKIEAAKQAGKLYNVMSGRSLPVLF